MTDFDFDEIDKAVNGAIGSDSSTDPSSSSAPAAPLASSTPPMTRESSTDQVMGSASYTVPPRPSEAGSTPIAPAARRSSGRFMDMVHPASDMRGRSGVSEAASRPSPIDTQNTPIQASPVTTQDSSPLQPEVSTDDSTESLQAGMESILAGDFQDAPVALESPFLPDAKVEKRPLGGSAFPDELTFEDLQPEQELIEAPEALDAIEQPAAESLLESPEAEPMIEAPEEVQLVQDAEPQNQLEPSEEPYIEESLPEPTTSDVDMVSADEAEAASQQEVAKEEFSAAPEIISAPLAGPASITQQYTETPSSAKETGAIFDTESYHQAIPASGKKKSALWAILWIVLLIIAGAGAGAAFYVYVLPML